MAKSSTKTSEQFRRADNGHYCTEEYANRHPRTTICEHRPKH